MSIKVQPLKVLQSLHCLVSSSLLFHPETRSSRGLPDLPTCCICLHIHRYCPRSHGRRRLLQDVPDPALHLGNVKRAFLDADQREGTDLPRFPSNLSSQVPPTPHQQQLLQLLKRPDIQVYFHLCLIVIYVRFSPIMILRSAGSHTVLSPAFCQVADRVPSLITRLKVSLPGGKWLKQPLLYPTTEPGLRPFHPAKSLGDPSSTFTSRVMRRKNLLLLSSCFCMVKICPMMIRSKQNCLVKIASC